MGAQWRALLPALIFITCGLVYAQDRETKVHLDKQQFIEDDSWIYGNLAEALLIAKRDQKPLMVVFRCIP